MLPYSKKFDIQMERWFNILDEIEWRSDMRSDRGGFTLIELLVVIVIIGILLSFLIPAVLSFLCMGRESETKNLVAQLGTACKAYWNDYRCYPPGDGTGSSDMANALKNEGPGGTPYFEFQSGQLDSSGNVLNPIYGETEIIYYKSPGTYNKYSFDMWAKDCKGVIDGVKNW